MTSSDTVWNTLELRAKNSGPPAGIVRLMVHPEARCSMYAAVEKPSLDRLFLARVDCEGTASLPELPSLRGLSVRYVTTGQLAQGYVVLELRLRNHEYGHLFAVIADDLAEYASGAPTQKKGIERLLQRLDRWRRFLERSELAWLSLEERRGLFGEITVLKEILQNSPLPRDAAVIGWRGPKHSNHDFEYDGCSIEVKTSCGNQEQRLHISSERQLDWSQTQRLFLVHVSVAEDTEDGLSLPELVESVSASLVGSQGEGQFDDLLLQAGYLKQDREVYVRPKYKIRAREIFEVKEGFPCILESDLRKGVGEVIYSIGVGSCQPFAVSADTLLGILREGAL